MKIVNKTARKVVLEFSNAEYTLMLESMGEFLHQFTPSKLKRVRFMRAALRGVHSNEIN